MTTKGDSDVIDPARPGPTEAGLLIPDGSSLVASSVVLLAPAVNAESLRPDLFGDIAETRKPQNQVVMGDFFLLDYGTVQCLVLPGEPRRLQVQTGAGASLADFGEYAKRLFRAAVSPTALGINFQRTMHFAPGRDPLSAYVRVADLRELLGPSVHSVGFNARFDASGWRTQLNVGPIPGGNDLQWQINFERTVRTAAEIEQGVDAISSVADMEARLAREVRWA